MTPREIDGVCHLPNQHPWAAVYGTAARNPRRTEDARTTLDAAMAYFEGRYVRQFFGHEVAAQLRVLAAAPPELVDHAAILREAAKVVEKAVGATAQKPRR